MLVFIIFLFGMSCEKNMKLNILYAVLILNLDYCLGATSIINPDNIEVVGLRFAPKIVEDNIEVVGLRYAPKIVEDRSLWDEITLVTRMASDLERRDILDAVIVAIKAGENIPGIPPLLVKCLKMLEHTLKLVQPVFWGVFPKTKPPGAKALKLPFKIPHMHIEISLIFKMVNHCFEIMQHPETLVTDVRNLPKIIVNIIIKFGKGVIKSRKKIVMGVAKLPKKIMNGLTKLSTKLTSGTMKSPVKFLHVGEGVVKSPFKMLGHFLHHGQSKHSKAVSEEKVEKNNEYTTNS